MVKWTRTCSVVAGLLVALVAVAAAADRIFTNPKPEGHLRALFPKAAAFSPLAGTPVHFKAYGADPKTTPNTPLLGYAFWTTDLVPNEFGYHGPIHVLVGMDLTGVTFQPPVTWDYVRRLKDATKMKFVIKGIVTREDAELAVAHGADAIVCSNHGGRADETGRSSIESLPEVVAGAGGRIPVLVDSGFRRGTDIFTALALGSVK